MSVNGRLALIIAFSMIAAACGRKGPLVYPDMLVPAAPAAVTVQQFGSAIKLQFVLSDKDRTGRPAQSVAGVKINRKISADGQRDECKSCTTDYTLFKTLYLDHLPANTQRFGGRLVFVDSEVLSGVAYSYSIVPFTADGVNGASSAATGVRVGAVPLPPPVLSVESFPTEVRLKTSVYPLIAARMLGYNLYRSSGTGPGSYLPINGDPLKGSEYVDGVIERGVKYRYTARALVVWPSGDVVESDESNMVEGMLKDDE